MKEKTYSGRSELICFLAVLCGIAFNVLCSLPNDLSDSPLYLDTIGTIVVSCAAGIFPGILTGVATNIVKVFFYDLSPYFAILSAVIAIIAAAFWHNRLMKKFTGNLLLAAFLALVGSIPGTWISFVLEDGEISNPYILKVMDFLMKRAGFGFIIADVSANFVFDLIDKCISVALALLILHFIPEKIKTVLGTSGLKQEYVPADSRKSSFSKMRRSLSTGTVGLIAVITIVAVGVMTWVSYMQFSTYTKDQATKDARHAVELFDSSIDKDELRECVWHGERAPAYKDVIEKLGLIRDVTPDLAHIYILFPAEDGFHFVFDLGSESGETYRYGQIVPYNDEFKPYIDDLLRGDEIDAVESSSDRGWILTVMKPILLASGSCLCYIGGDIDISSLNDYQNRFMVRVVLVTAALLMVVLACSFRLARNRLVLPINSMAYCANEFIADYDLKGVFDEARRINRLKIKTGDEIENLYQSFKKMSVDMVAREQNIRKQTETITRMQNGLIVILADMVENRDNDTGNHVKRTSGYVRLIMESLRKKGYYLDQLTDTFVSDVIQSAPLHDLGKIGISDIILNKPGKLTPEEFEIMKTHTTIGGQILERAISEVHGESYLREAMNLAAYHHEKWNGGGYPKGLSGEDIPLSARIMAIADVFDAVSQKRVYKEAFTFEQSVEIIRKGSGDNFDPKCVEAFMDCLDSIKEVLESDGEEDIAM